MDNSSLTEFVESVCNESHLRVETDLGGGFVRLKSEEAERRQAAHDVRTTEDALIELLRNSRDAHAHTIFVATSKNEDKRSLLVIDDGDGVPEAMQSLIFEPRVTSKLDTMHIDKWGVHGRGMALYAVRTNADAASIIDSREGRGTSLLAVFSLNRISEKTDQSSFPQFDLKDSGSVSVRGPKNILRTCCEFAFEHRNDISLYVGSPSEIVATLYAYGCATLSLLDRTFASGNDDVVITKRIALAADEEMLQEIAAGMGLDISLRTAYRIMKGEIKPLASLAERIQEAILAQMSNESAQKHVPSKSKKSTKGHRISISEEDLEDFAQKVAGDFVDLSQAYYLEPHIKPRVSVHGSELIVRIPLQLQ